MPHRITLADVRRIADPTDYVLSPTEREYVQYHGRRLVAILRLVERFVRERIAQRGRPVKLLDVGPHFLTRCLHDLFGKDVEIHTLGYRHPGLVAESMVARHHQYDLDQAQRRELWLRCEGHDLIVMAEVIEHLHTSPNLVLQFMRSLLRDGGVLIVQTPNAVSLQRRLGVLWGRNPYDLIRDDTLNPGHFREYTAAELTQYCRSNGLQDVVTIKQSYWPTTALRRLAGAVFPNLREGLLVAARRVPNATLDATTTIDSTTRTALAADFDLRLRHRVRLGEKLRGTVRLRNTGAATWLSDGVNGGHGAVRLCARTLDAQGRVEFDFFRQPVADRPVLPGEEIEFPIDLAAPRQGVFEVEFALLAEGVAWFQDLGCSVSRHTFEVE
jgi:SAM-dependent methyltransferase